MAGPSKGARLMKRTTTAVLFSSPTKEMHAAATMIQGQFRRLTVMKRMAVLWRLKKKHEKLQRLNAGDTRPGGWTHNDTMANMLQSSFIAKLCRKAVQKAAQFMTRATSTVLCDEEVLHVLHTHHRTEDDLAVLQIHFSELAFMKALSTRIQQLQACRYFHSRTVPCGTKLFEVGDVGDKLYILLRGQVEVRVDAKAKAACVNLICGAGDSFGEQSLRGENEGRRDATVTTMEDCLLAQMERADFLRVTGTLIEECVAVLRQPHEDNSRTLLQLQLCRNLFYGTDFFTELHFVLLQIHCCDVMSLVEVSPGSRVYVQGTTGDCFYIVIKGQVGAYVKQAGRGDSKGNGELEKEILEGQAFGEAALTGKGNAARRRAETVVAMGDEKVFLAKLLRNDYVDITNKIEKQVYKALNTPSRTRSLEQIDMLFEFLREEEFFKVIQLDGMRQQCCKAMMMQRVGVGELLFAQGDHGETFHIVIRGTVRVVIHGETIRSLSAGSAFGEIALLGETDSERVRTASIIAVSDCLFATLTRHDFLKVHDRQELTYWINKFWVLTTTKIDPENHDSVTWKGYKKLHLLIAKTIDKAYNTKKAITVARKDWVGDLNRHNKGGQSLNHAQFCDALFELVDIWCKGCTTMLLYVEFLRTTFLNITVVLHDRAHKNSKGGKTKDQPHQFQSYTMKKVNQVKCRTDQLTELKQMHMDHQKHDEEMMDKERGEIQDMGEIEEEDIYAEVVDEPEPEPEQEQEDMMMIAHAVQGHHFDTSSSEDSESDDHSSTSEEEEMTVSRGNPGGGSIRTAQSNHAGKGVNKVRMLEKAASRSSMFGHVSNRPTNPEDRGGHISSGVVDQEGFERDGEGQHMLAGQSKHHRHKHHHHDPADIGTGKGVLKGGKKWRAGRRNQEEEMYQGLGVSEQQQRERESHSWNADGNAGGGGFSQMHQSLGGDQDFKGSLGGAVYNDRGWKDKPVWRSGGKRKQPVHPQFGLAPQTPPSGIGGTRVQRPGGSLRPTKSSGKKKKRKSTDASPSGRRPQTREDPGRRENSEGREFGRDLRDTSDSVGPGDGKPNTQPNMIEHHRPPPSPELQRKAQREAVVNRRKERRRYKKDMKRMRAAATAETCHEIAQATKASALGFDFDFDLSMLPQDKIDEWVHLRSQLRNSGLAGRKRGIAWFRNVMRELHIIPALPTDQGPMAAADMSIASGVELYNEEYDEDIDGSDGARQSTFKWNMSLRTYAAGGSPTPKVEQSQRSLGIAGQTTGKEIVYKSVDPRPQPPADLFAQNLKAVAQTWERQERPWGDEDGSYGLGADVGARVDTSLAVALHDRTRGSGWKGAGGGGGAVSGMRMTQAERDAEAGYRWPPRESDFLPAL